LFLDSPIVEINGGGIINENERLTLVCHVDSYPSIDYYQWYRNSEKLNISSLSSSIIIEKVSKDDAGVYICMVKNTLKYFNGSSIEKFNKTQTKVIVQCKEKNKIFLIKNFLNPHFRCSESLHISSNHCRRSLNN
jgi:hypothetical protein